MLRDPRRRQAYDRQLDGGELACPNAAGGGPGERRPRTGGPSAPGAHAPGPPVLQARRRRDLEARQDYAALIRNLQTALTFEPGNEPSSRRTLAAPAQAPPRLTDTRAAGSPRIRPTTAPRGPARGSPIDSVRGPGWHPARRPVDRRRSSDPLTSPAATSGPPRPARFRNGPHLRNGKEELRIDHGGGSRGQLPGRDRSCPFLKIPERRGSLSRRTQVRELRRDLPRRAQHLLELRHASRVSSRRPSSRTRASSTSTRSCTDRFRASKCRTSRRSSTSTAVERSRAT